MSRQILHAESDEVLEAAIEHAAHLLPVQGPIGVFVHHNTLHAFEDRPFLRAVVDAARIFGAEPFMPAAWYRDRLNEGRITTEDLEAVLAETPDPDTPMLGGRITRGSLRRQLLVQASVDADDASIDWMLKERVLAPAHEIDAVLALWSACKLRVRGSSITHTDAVFSPGAPRLRDELLRFTTRDADQLVHAVLVPALSAFLDQGVAYWPMADREAGFHAAFCKVLREGAPIPIPIVADLRKRLSADLERGHDASESVRASLARLGLAQSEWAPYLAAVCLALPGWAGIVRKLEREPELAPYRCPPCRLVDYLAVRLLLDEAAAVRVARDELGLDAEPAVLLRSLRTLPAPRRDDAVHQTAFAVFQVARACGLSADALLELPDAEIEALLAELSVFDDFERRRLLQLAYERRHRRSVLRPLARHRATTDPSRTAGPTPRIQAAFCIDEREESLRRHLEEQDPEIETFGAAGFFGLAIAYRGIDDGHHAALCPVVQVPAHEVREVGVDEGVARRYLGRRRLWSFLSFGNFFGSRSLVRGWITTLGFGLLSMLPLTLRVLFPGPVTRLAARLRPLLLPRPQTQLAMHRASEAPAGSRWQAGFTEAEMADRVAKLLRDIGLVRHWAPLVAMIGHGSASLNNPHESAHDCGACGGRRGVPNGRLFAAMANDPRVRVLLRERGVAIPADTVFVGGYHDTCNDAVRFFDVEAIPASHQGHFEHLRAMLDRARVLDAHERCRRFESVPLDVTPEAALLHVEGRAENLAEPRPEYGHATNAVCIFGRRGLTRGLFLDRRAFLVSYDPTMDPDARTLGGLLAAMGPVGAGISLEYYFSFVDNERYGCGTKLPHNIAGLVGVMNGHVSDLRTGLPWQMVEIHEPVRLLVIVEATPAAIAAVVERYPEVGDLVARGWIQLALIDPATGVITEHHEGAFVPVAPADEPLPVVGRSSEWYAGHRDHLPIALVTRGLPQ